MTMVTDRASDGRDGPAAVERADTGPLRRSDPGAEGIRRRRCGRGFRYLGLDAPVTDPRTLARIKALVIPPAWEDVWICPDPCGHIQAVGTDSAGRRQYLYHERWRERRDQEKHDRIRELGAALPRVRAVVTRHLDGRGLSRDRVLAAAVRLKPVVRSSSPPRAGPRISLNGLACAACVDPGLATAPLANPRNLHPG